MVKEVAGIGVEMSMPTRGTAYAKAQRGEAGSMGETPGSTVRGEEGRVRGGGSCH